MDILKEVEKLPVKKKLSHHKESILLMRKKGYSFRNIAEFLTSKGIKTDHTRVFKLIKGEKNED